MSQSQSQFDLDWKTEEILWALAELENPATSSDIREVTTLDNTDIINYRLREKLEPRGIVDLQQPLADDGRSLPKKVTLTESGETLAADVAARRTDEASLDGTLTALSDSLDQLGTRVTQLEQRVEDSDASQSDEITETIAELRDDQDALQEQVSKLAMRFTEVDQSRYGGLSDDAIDEIKTLRVAVRGLREFVVEDLEREEELKAQVRAAADDLKSQDAN